MPLWGRNLAQPDAIVYAFKLINFVSVFFVSNIDCLLLLRNQERCHSAEMPVGV